MSSESTLCTIASRDVAFRDIGELNTKLVEYKFDFHENWDYNEGDPIPDVFGFKDGELLFRGWDDDRPQSNVQTYDCWYLEDSQIIAEHMTSGRLLLCLQPEYETATYHLLKPGKAMKIGAEALLEYDF